MRGKSNHIKHLSVNLLLKRVILQPLTHHLKYTYESKYQKCGKQLIYYRNSEAWDKKFLYLLQHTQKF